MSQSSDRAHQYRRLAEKLHSIAEITQNADAIAELLWIFASHETVHHSVNEHVRGGVHVNTAEGFFGVFKRGMRGVYQHCSEKHLHRYLAEFDFRFNRRASLGWTDEARTIEAVRGAVGKRLTYHQPNESGL
jgi:ISXO2-like transposase domain